MRRIFALIALSGSVAEADPKPDPVADIESREANLESNEPREGITFALAIGGGVQGGGGVGTGGAVSLRLGHVATRTTVLTFEITGTGKRHKPPGVNDPIVTDTNVGLFVGAQRYASRSLWVRIAGGADVYNKDIGISSQSNHGGIGGLVGAGLDFVRWGYLVLGAEGFAMAGITGDGPKVNTGFLFGLSYY